MFEEYIKNGIPEQKERAENWQIAIGLQDVDNLKVSQVLIELARRHIEGKITIEEVVVLCQDLVQVKMRNFAPF